MIRLEAHVEDSKDLAEIIQSECFSGGDFVCLFVTVLFLLLSCSDTLMEHLNEIRGLRQRLEKSIENNDLLREKLEEKIRQKEGRDPDVSRSDTL